MEQNIGNRKVQLFAAMVLVCIFTYLPLTVYAHSGGTDQYGGHHDYNNVSGLGDYHYHHGFPAHLHENGVCPYEGEDPYYSSSSSDSSSSGSSVTKSIPDPVEPAKTAPADTGNNTWLWILAIIFMPIILAAVCVGLIVLFLPTRSQSKERRTR